MFLLGVQHIATPLIIDGASRLHPRTRYVNRLLGRLLCTPLYYPLVHHTARVQCTRARTHNKQRNNYRAYRENNKRWGHGAHTRSTDGPLKRAAREVRTYGTSALRIPATLVRLSGPRFSGVCSISFRVGHDRHAVSDLVVVHGDPHSASRASLRGLGFRRSSPWLSARLPAARHTHARKQP